MTYLDVIETDWWKRIAILSLATSQGFTPEERAKWKAIYRDRYVS